MLCGKKPPLSRRKMRPLTSVAIYEVAKAEKLHSKRPSRRAGRAWREHHRAICKWCVASGISRSDTGRSSTAARNSGHRFYLLCVTAPHPELKHKAIKIGPIGSGRDIRAGARPPGKA